MQCDIESALNAFNEAISPALADRKQIDADEPTSAFQFIGDDGEQRSAPYVAFGMRGSPTEDVAQALADGISEYLRERPGVIVWRRRPSVEIFADQVKITCRMAVVPALG